MSHSPSQNSNDKFEVHYRQQLSALIDGELPPDEARFLLRRLQHDEELAGCHERWQLCGDVMRGLATAPAPADFAARVRRALAEEAVVPAVAASTGRPGWRWGGGAIAASVALVALFMVRDRVPGDAPTADAPMPVIATTAQLPARAPATPAGEGVAAAVPAAAALASARRQDAGRAVASATRSQQAGRSAASRRDAAERQVATAAALPSSVMVAAAEAPAPAAAANPFAHPAPEVLQARPWPRSALSGTGSTLNARWDEGAPATFYPFEPRQALPAVESTQDAPGPLPPR